MITPTHVQAPAAAQPPLALVGAIAGENEGIAIFLDGTTKGVICLKTGESPRRMDVAISEIARSDFPKRTKKRNSHAVFLQQNDQ